MDKKREMKLALSFLPNMSAEDKKRIWETGISWESVEVLLGKDKMELFLKELEWASDTSLPQHGYVFIDEDDYPLSLKADPLAPYRLAYLGEKPKGADGEFNSAHSLTIVGTRRCSSIGIRSAFTFSSEASSAGLVIYSGYADGIDKAAHFGAISQRNPTFGILASGLGHSYTHRRPKMEEEMLMYGGGLLSPFAANSEPYKGNFHYRNRILASISDATVVIEAPAHSGALITAYEANDMGKSVFVHTASMRLSHLGEGLRNLKNEGAEAVSSYSSLSERHLQFPEGLVSVAVNKSNIASLKAKKDGGEVGRIVGYNGTYYTLM